MKKSTIVLVIGASRGIGRELVRQYRDEGVAVHATCRKDVDMDALRALGCTVHRLDVTDPDHWSALGRAIATTGVDVAIHNAGVSGPRYDGAPTRDDFDETMRSNVWAAMLMTPVVAPRVAAVHGKLVIVSSRMGSIGARDSAAFTTYRASKAAVNSVAKDAAIVYGPQGLTCVAMHPGWVRTEMGGAGADLDVSESAKGIRKTIAGLSHGDNGCFFSYDGTPMRW
jgi:NAD(P)-dependent dehydrogenase (short-subunit alcohol dehydrogenase family)